jgi:hypothetical protein
VLKISVSNTRTRTRTLLQLKAIVSTSEMLSGFHLKIQSRLQKCWPLVCGILPPPKAAPETGYNIKGQLTHRNASSLGEGD